MKLNSQIYLISGFKATWYWEMYRLVSDLYPICRSITGNGFRETLNIRLYFLRGSWSSYRNWSIWLTKRVEHTRRIHKNLKGERIVDFKKFNLHVVNYSVPVNKLMPFEELKTHLFTLPDYPDRIPYRTSYYKESWGFVWATSSFLALKDEEYGLHRFYFRRRLSYLRRVLPSGERGWSTDILPRLPSVAFVMIISGIALATFWQNIWAKFRRDTL